MKFSAVFALVFGALSMALFSGSAHAELKVGDKAPSFVTKASLAGKEFSFSLVAALSKGPVVLYFYPAAFTKGCTIEAHEFAEATDRFKSLGATVIGVSNDDIATLNRFSVSECRNKFAVASAKGNTIIKDYDAGLMLKPEMADRTSYVIAPEGKIIYVYSAMNPENHVANTMQAVEAWVAQHKPEK